MGKYKCIIFDLDGTVLDTERMNFVPLQRLIKEELGLEIEYEKNEGETIDEKEEVICEQLPKQWVKVKQGNKVMVQISK